MGLCERCKKAQATFHLTNIDRSGGKAERHLCDKCAAEEGLLQTPKAGVNLNEILENFIAGSKAGSSELSNLVCEECGISYVEFRNQGLLGCPNDYDVFHEQIARLLERTHDGAKHHVGKTPKSLGTAVRKTHQEIRRLKRQLDEAVVAEDYERAAELRDRIREVEKA
ncbi:MAG: UvrB/UvrC motif-containing protein [Phycisphaerae bacterium]|nr:UvrB/UvrC motif-containing protein [Phycisphaerae bacterium]